MIKQVLCGIFIGLMTFMPVHAASKPITFRDIKDERIAYRAIKAVLEVRTTGKPIFNSQQRDIFVGLLAEGARPTVLEVGKMCMKVLNDVNKCKEFVIRSINAHNQYVDGETSWNLADGAQKYYSSDNRYYAAQLKRFDNDMGVFDASDDSIVCVMPYSPLKEIDFGQYQKCMASETASQAFYFDGQGLQILLDTPENLAQCEMLFEEYVSSNKVAKPKLSYCNGIKTRSDGIKKLRRWTFVSQNSVKYKEYMALWNRYNTAKIASRDPLLWTQGDCDLIAKIDRLEDDMDRFEKAMKNFVNTEEQLVGAEYVSVHVKRDLTKKVTLQFKLFAETATETEERAFVMTEQDLRDRLAPYGFETIFYVGSDIRCTGVCNQKMGTQDIVTCTIGDKIVVEYEFDSICNVRKRVLGF